MSYALALDETQPTWGISAPIDRQPATLFESENETRSICEREEALRAPLIESKLGRPMTEDERLSEIGVCRAGRHSAVTDRRHDVAVHLLAGVAIGYFCYRGYRALRRS